MYMCIIAERLAIASYTIVVATGHIACYYIYPSLVRWSHHHHIQYITLYHQ